MNNPLFLLPPVVNVIVTGLFATVILRQYLNRHRTHQLYWSIALCMAFIATLAYICMLLVHPTSATGMLLFRTYYILGGEVMPAWLGLGSLALVSSQRITRISFIVLCILSVCAAISNFLASIDLQKLSQIAGTPGTGILQPGVWLVLTIVLNTLGVVAVAGGALYSGWKLLRRQASVGGLRTSRVLWANVLIFIGAMLDAAAGSLARFLGLQDTFWLVMAFGWIVLFSGVLLTSRRSSVVKPATSATQETVQPINI